MIGITREASPLVAIVLPSLLVTMMTSCLHLPLHPLIVQTTKLAIVLAQVKNMIPVHHVSITNAVSAKTPALSNGNWVYHKVPGTHGGVLVPSQVIIQCGSFGKGRHQETLQIFVDI